jgi:hypothetical protein
LSIGRPLSAMFFPFQKSRLGGLSFPPVVYYKIFLRGSVTDLGSFAPRDYTRGKPTQHYVLQRHNTESLDETRAARVREVTMEVDKTSWYQRFENNGWRPIATKHFNGRDYITSMTSQARKSDFHHLSETRRKKAELKREQKRTQWMKRMYKGCCPASAHMSHLHSVAQSRNA